MMKIIILIFAGLLGAIIGSFLNVCIYRLPKEYMSIVKPRSHCTFCGNIIKWYDNIPIISWFLLGGSCRYCKFPISFRYTLVEGLTSILFILFTNIIIFSNKFQHYSLLQKCFILSLSYYFISLMIVVTFIDIDYRIIPDILTYSGVFLSILISTLDPVLHTNLIAFPLIKNRHILGFINSIFGIIVGGGSLYLVGVIGKIFFRKEAMGLGDVKFMAAVGGFLGWDSSLLIFFIACFLGSIIGIIILLVTKDHYIPFGPYLAIGTLLIFIWKKEVMDILLNFWPNLMSKWLFLNY